MSDERVVRGISIAEASARFPEAMVKFDHQCRHLHDAPNLRFTVRRLGGRVDGAEYLRAAGNLTSSSCRSARYDLATGCWIRYSRGVASHPRRDIGEDMPGPYVLEWVDEAWTMRIADVRISIVKHGTGEWWLDPDVGVPYYSMRAHDALDVSIAPHDPAPPNA